MADSAAARKQAEGAHRHLEGLTSNDPTVSSAIVCLHISLIVILET